MYMYDINIEVLLNNWSTTVNYRIRQIMKLMLNIGGNANKC